MHTEWRAAESRARGNGRMFLNRKSSRKRKIVKDMGSTGRRSGANGRRRTTKANDFRMYNLIAGGDDG